MHHGLIVCNFGVLFSQPEENVGQCLAILWPTLAFHPIFSPVEELPLHDRVEWIRSVEPATLLKP